jgi:hypothetical protein
MRRVNVSIVAVEKQLNITYSECVFVALIIQLAKGMHRVVLSSVARLAVPYFYTLSHKRNIFRKGIAEQKLGFDFFYNFRPKHFSFK